MKVQSTIDRDNEVFSEANRGSEFAHDLHRLGARFKREAKSAIARLFRHD